MLSMKTLRVAIVTMGSALLLGPGLAAAIDLDGTAAGMNAPVPILVATQTIPAAVAPSMLHHVNLGAGAEIAITPGILLEAEDRYFLRVELGDGAMFHTAPSVSGATPVQGGENSAQAVFRLGEVGLTASIDVSITDNVGLPSMDAAEYTASMTVHTEQFDAIDGVGAIRSIGAEDVVIVRTVNGIVSAVASATVTADVGVGFRWFVNPDAEARADAPNVSGVGLGTASAMANAMAGVLNADDGEVVIDADLIDADTGVRIAISGDFSVGALDLVGDADNDDAIDACPPRVGTEDTPMMGALQPTEDEPNMAMSAWMEPGAYQLCLEVDVAGPMSNPTAIPKTEYTASVYTRANATATPSAGAEGTIGVIGRNGASVDIPFLTTYERHNQRLIIVNRGANPIMITDIAFQTEDGTEASLSELAMAAAMIPGAGEIGSGETAVHSVKKMLSITGDTTRTAATLSFNGRSQDITVATTLVNPEIRATDTVVYEVN